MFEVWYQWHDTDNCPELQETFATEEEAVNWISERSEIQFEDHWENDLGAMYWISNTEELPGPTMTITIQTSDKISVTENEISDSLNPAEIGEYLVCAIQELWADGVDPTAMNISIKFS